MNKQEQQNLNQPKVEKILANTQIRINFFYFKEYIVKVPEKYGKTEVIIIIQKRDKKPHLFKI